MFWKWYSRFSRCLLGNSVCFLYVTGKLPLMIILVWILMSSVIPQVYKEVQQYNQAVVIKEQMPLSTSNIFDYLAFIFSASVLIVILIDNIWGHYRFISICRDNSLRGKFFPSSSPSPQTVVKSTFDHISSYYETFNMNAIKITGPAA